MPAQARATAVTVNGMCEFGNCTDPGVGESDSDFFSNVSSDELTFEVDSSDRVTGMTLHLDGRNGPVKRVE